MANSFQPLILGLGGTMRPGSGSEHALRHALAAAEALGARTQLIDGSFLGRLPHYTPEATERTPDEVALIAAVLACDGLIVSTPGYHGSISGPIKNALDLIDETARSARVYLEGRAFGAIVTAQGSQACGTTLVTLRSIAHALRAWPTPYGATLSASAPLFDRESGQCLDPKAGRQLAMVATQVVQFAHWRHAGMEAECGASGDGTP
ncbi:MAG TPA: NAD(P)H-dependent oxidoreductase [Rhizomicrobium sp.]|jgi:FMN reductase